MHRSILPGLLLSAIAVSANAQSYSVEIYGGVVPSRDEDYDGVPFDLESGTALGFGAYSNTLVDGVELGIDVMRTDARYEGFTSGVESLSLMLAGRLPFPIGDTATGYLGAGLGVIEVTYDGSTDFPAFTGEDQVVGGQVSLGVRYNVSPTIGVFAEIRHQRAFEDAEVPGATQSLATTSALVGLSFGF